MKKFRRFKEDFTCGHCGFQVTGNGYTNHCPQCLWSKHVDINPGDRAAQCRGLMEPVGIEIKSGNYVILHKCTVCRITKKNKTVPEDNFEAILAIAGNMH